MEIVISKDHTPIVYEASGNGPALLLVHGGGSTPERWRPILSRFESNFTVYRMSRRGVGGSSAASGYAVERQGEDIAALVDAIGEPVALLGHSFGGLCATLLLVGGESPGWAQDATRQLHQAVGTSRVVAMPGQQHIAMDTAPDLFVREVMAFLNAS